MSDSLSLRRRSRFRVVGAWRTLVVGHKCREVLALRGTIRAESGACSVLKTGRSSYFVRTDWGDRGRPPNDTYGQVLVVDRNSSMPWKKRRESVCASNNIWGTEEFASNTYWRSGVVQVMYVTPGINH